MMTLPVNVRVEAAPIKSDEVSINEARRLMTLAAMEDLDAGRVVEHQSVSAWAEKLSQAD